MKLKFVLNNMRLSRVLLNKGYLGGLNINASQIGQLGEQLSATATDAVVEKSTLSAAAIKTLKTTDRHLVAQDMSVKGVQVTVNVNLGVMNITITKTYD